MALPAIHTEDASGHVTGFIQPDREFWRYLFAGMAMQGMVGDEQSRREARGGGSEEAGIAHWSVSHADALLAELEEGKEGGDG